MQFICGGGGAAEDGIVSVTEPAEKKYLIALRTGAMCGGGAGAAGAGGAAEGVARAASAGAASAGAVGAGMATAAAAGGRVAAGGGDTAGAGVQVAELRLSPLGLLEKLSTRCFTLTSGYWTYESCPGRSAKQVRVVCFLLSVPVAFGPGCEPECSGVMPQGKRTSTAVVAALTRATSYVQPTLTSQTIHSHTHTLTPPRLFLAQRTYRSLPPPPMYSTVWRARPPPPRFRWARMTKPEIGSRSGLPMALPQVGAKGGGGGNKSWVGMG